MFEHCTVYILKNSDKSNSDSIFSFVSQIFNIGSDTITVILELESTMIELSSVTKIKDFELNITKKYGKQIPLYLDFKKISNQHNIYFLSEKSFDYNDLYTCEYVDSKTSNPVFKIEKLQFNKQHSKYKIGYNSNIINQDLLVYLLEWIFVKNK
jgi:hypothetical protein